MKVLYIGCYRDGTGWGHAAQDYILSLDSVGVDVVPRYIKLNNNVVDIPEKISKLELKSDKDCNVVIQHVLPHMMDYNGNFDKNIALYVTETDHCKNTTWPERISLMDEAWVPNKFMAETACVNSKISCPHYVIPHAADMTKYQKEYEPLIIPEIDGKFVFYFIGEINRRKNLGAMLKAFHLEFRPEEDVSILIKAHLPGQTEEESLNSLSSMCSKVKEGLKLYEKDFYHKEILLCQYLREEEIMRLHQTCDCFVSTAFGEAWGIPIFDAMAMGKTPICTETGGPQDFLGDGGYLVKSNKESCFGVLDSFPELYVGNESWDAPSINEIRRCMRSAFENKKERENKARAGIEQSYKYSYSNIGLLMKRTIEGENKNLAFNANNEILKKHCIENILK
jgi:glycosyltransferase involved in cell wall biosynthesis